MSYQSCEELDVYPLCLTTGCGIGIRYVDKLYTMQEKVKNHV